MGSKKNGLGDAVYPTLELAVMDALKSGVDFEILKKVEWKITDPSVDAPRFPNFGFGVNAGK